MPLYEYRKNAENTIPLPEEIRDSITVGTAASCRVLLDHLAAKMSAGAPGVLLVDGWYGVDWKSLRAGLAEAAEKSALVLVFESTSSLFRNDLADYRKKFVSDDPSFGWVNKEGTLADILADLRSISTEEAHSILTRHHGSLRSALDDIE